MPLPLLKYKDRKDVIRPAADVSGLPLADKDLVLHVQIVLQIRLPHLMEDEQWSLLRSIAINRWSRSLLLEPSENTMVALLDNVAIPLSCVRPAEHRAKVSSLGARRMLRSWENSTNLCARTQRRIQVQHGQYML
jgi:hypothetical protein